MINYFEINDLPCQHAYANQFGKDGKMGDYNLISSNQDPLGTWPKSLSENEVFHVLEFVKQFEREAYVRGRADEEKAAKIYINEMKARYEAIIDKLNRDLESIGTQLDLIEQEN